jgi:hypothetical protein
MSRVISACALLWSTSVHAQDFTPVVTPGAGGAGRDTQAYIGLAWELGANRAPGARVVVGARTTEVDGDDLLGVDLNAWFDLTAGLDRIALSGLAGTRSVQLNAGAGYDFAGQQPILTAAIQVPGVRVGTDYGLHRRKFVPYVELNLLQAPEATAGDTLSCSTSGYVLVTRSQLSGFGLEVFDFIESEGLDIDGRACMDAGFLA